MQTLYQLSYAPKKKGLSTIKDFFGGFVNRKNIPGRIFASSP